MIRPLGDRLLVKRLEGHGIERVLPSGIVLPATREGGIQTKSDYFRARVVALSDECRRLMPDLATGDEVLVYTYAGEGDRVFTARDEETEHGLFIRADDIVCAIGHPPWGFVAATYPGPSYRGAA